MAKNKLFTVSSLLFIIFLFTSTNAVSLSPLPRVECEIKGEIVNVTYEPADPPTYSNRPNHPDRYILDIDIDYLNQTFPHNISSLSQNCSQRIEGSSIVIPDEENVDEHVLTPGNRINGTLESFFLLPLEEYDVEGDERHQLNKDQLTHLFRLEEYDVEGDERAPVDKPNPIILHVKYAFELIETFFNQHVF